MNMVIEELAQLLTKFFLLIILLVSFVLFTENSTGGSGLNHGTECHG